MDTGDRAAQLLAAGVPATASKLHRCDRRLHGVRCVHRRRPNVLLHGNEIVPCGVQRIEHELQEHVARRHGRRVRHMGSVAGVHARVRVYGESTQLYLAVGTYNDAGLSVGRQSNRWHVGSRGDVSELVVRGRHVSTQSAELYLAVGTDNDAGLSVGR